ncbi:hypothetical protein CP967_08165 [Streptomyces nitrosporeus]|uniref:Sensor domain-containing protein n=1 Tax=Streptomyces nitrosporeus TaxID=28894 RepID=A0A5J6FA80_9ACTN|nr:hypothetical protein [Streptomyces nitrosporeus]QEU71945.1 hypothetical protein CP967_08165 [Streptomyces nitrosporeus]GGY81667.1 lipoprotein [Streptomyces nitrosporeus]
MFELFARGDGGTGRRGALAAACAVAVLAGAGGCGEDGSGGGDGRAAKSPAPAATAPSAGAAPSGGLTEAQLTEAALTEGERAGVHTVSEYVLDGPHSDMYTADPAVCQPLVSLAGDVSGHEPTAQVQRKTDILDDMRGVTVDVTLRSYPGDGAAEVMRALGKAGTECAGGFTEERALVRAGYEKTEPAALPPFADEADEAEAYRFTIRDVKDELKLYEYLTVLRSGSTTLAFRAESLGTEDFGGVPQEVMDAQWKKFRAAAG